MEVNNGSTEDRIIYATIKLLDQYGLSGTTTRKIATEAGVSEVTIFRKFKTKHNLLNITKKFYYDDFLEKVENIFEFDENTDLREYLIDVWKKSVALTDEDLNIMKIGIDELREIPFEDKVLPKFANIILFKLSSFFKLQIEKENIREINPNVAALNILGIILEGIIIWKIYIKEPNGDVDSYLNDFLDIFINGISINKLE